ncbi:DUF1961 family protein [Gracilibacillus alcaliphilus]|uniref:DUF1961 family protein n=1 Tax=Gracilibacillus alcaliphilus TaxID=1401441 RepID=UPI00195EFA28|nr:DUF1961 family protein [Gracilibacillus alcaliphilus]MBM7677434.1 hypothetical protein [Gracilibacillus alcaliphilus]
MNWQEQYDHQLIYHNPLQDQADINDFRIEGEAALSFPLQRLRMENKKDPLQGQKSNFVLWCPEDFPENIAVTWDFWPIREPGLCILFFAAKGGAGEDLFSSSLTKRTGIYDQYHHGDINAYHVSYYRRKWEDERQFHTSNLRKSYGFHLVAQGADPLPNVEDAKGPYQLELVKYQGDITFYMNQLPIFHFHDDGREYGPYLKDGKIGFRQMAPLIAEYANLKVFQLREK